MPESEADIQIFNQTDTALPLAQSSYAKIAALIADHEDCSFNFIELVYVDEEEIVRINKEHLERDYITDIITFRYDESEHYTAIEGTLFCCAPRIKEQAMEFSESEENEFARIFIHGLLHLAGYDDQSEEAQRVMTEKENFYLTSLA